MPRAMWLALMTLAGEAPWCEFTPLGRCYIVAAFVFGIEIFAIPAGAFMSAYQTYLEQLYFEGVLDDDDDDEDGEGDGDGDENAGSPPRSTMAIMDADAGDRYFHLSHGGMQSYANADPRSQQGLRQRRGSPTGSGRSSPTGSVGPHGMRGSGGGNHQHHRNSANEEERMKQQLLADPDRKDGMLRAYVPRPN